VSQERFEELRRKAEDRLAEKKDRIKSLERADLEKLAHELAVHQVELEIQNEELRRTRLEAEEIRDRYIDLFDFAPVGYFTLDEHNRIVEANLAGCQLLKIDRNAILKLSFTKFIQTEDSEKFFFQRRKALENHTRQTGELRLQTAVGTPFHAQIESLKVGGEKLRLAVIDITERKKVEETLAQQKIELEAAYKEMEAFSYSVSHDLRAPLRTMNGFSQAVLEDCADQLDEQGKEYLLRIRTASQTMAQLIDDLLNLSRLSQSEMYFDKVNLSDLARSIANKLKATQPERQVEFIIAPDIVVNGDLRLLQTLLRNLMENAWKFSGNCLQTRIEFGKDIREEKVVYFMKDNGAGFNMQYADKLFLPFRRLHSSSEYPGNGIGLALSQRVVQRHGGRIWAESAVGQGATFYFTLE
jgi:PAS domain S-box-containing protein